MSNLIKAQQIQYAEKIKTIDMNARADELTQQFVNKYVADNLVMKQLDFNEVSKKLEAEKVITPEDVDFTPGLNLERIFVDDSETDSGQEMAEAVYPQDEQEQVYTTTGASGTAVVEIEARVREKKRELDELQAKIAQLQTESQKIIEQANVEAQGIIDNACAEAEVKKEEIFEQAKAEGFEAGQAEAQAEIDRIRDESEEVKQQYKEEYEKQVEALEPAFVEILINYIRKLTGIYAEDKREIILHLIDNAMRDKRGAENFIIRVSEADFAVASYSRDSMRNYLPDGASIEIVADKLLSKNQCMIETDSRIFDCSLDSQMIGLIEDIRLLAEKD